MDYSIFSSYTTIPRNKRVTVIDSPYEDKENDAPCTGTINVFDYYRGNIVKGTLESFDIGEISDRIFKYPYRDELYVHEDAEEAYEMVLYGAGIYQKAQGNPEEVKKILAELDRIHDVSDDMT